MITLKLFQQIFYLAMPLVLLERQRPNSRSWKKRKYQITKYKSRVRLINFNWNVILFFSEMEGKKITHILARFSLVKWSLIPSHSKSLKSAIFCYKKGETMFSDLVPWIAFPNSQNSFVYCVETKHESIPFTKKAFSI